MSVPALRAAETDKQPVFFLLYSRYSDYVNIRSNTERILRSIPAIADLRASFPEYKANVTVQMTGAMAEKLDGLDRLNRPEVKLLKDRAQSGAVQFGYFGADEPTPRARKRPRTAHAETPAERWEAYLASAEAFLTRYKDPIYGEEMPDVSGGLRRLQELFGTAATVSHYVDYYGGDAPAAHFAKYLAPRSLYWGQLAPDPYRDIHGFGGSVGIVARTAAADKFCSPELYWESGLLRSSDMSLRDLPPYISSGDGPEPLRKVLAGLDRSKVRVIHAEYCGYKRYLSVRPDGSLIFPTPLQYAWDNPESPRFPSTVRNFREPSQTLIEYNQDAKFLRYLVEEFFPANPGSRFISPAELVDMATPASQISVDAFDEAIAEMDRQFTAAPNYPPNFAVARGQYLSLAEVFGLLTSSLAARQAGQKPTSLPVKHVYGPLMVTSEMGLNAGEVKVSSILRVASELAPALGDDTWKSLPSNVVPSSLTVDGVRLLPSQLLRLMVAAYRESDPNKVLPVRMCRTRNTVGENYPHNVPLDDVGCVWTFKPAPLKLA
ncbi:MAG: hypothetical protein NTV70_12210 [Acidobacteria bacterium]|nr:hypothetical protein [Acidobacteriota bacterium]